MPHDGWHPRITTIATIGLTTGGPSWRGDVPAVRRRQRPDRRCRPAHADQANRFRLLDDGQRRKR
jgi:hypothetical protein